MIFCRRISRKAIIHAMILFLIFCASDNQAIAFSVMPALKLSHSSFLTTSTSPPLLWSSAKAPVDRLGGLATATNKCNTLLFFKDENIKDDDSSSPSALVELKNETCIPNNIDFFLKPVLPLFVKPSTQNNTSIEEQRTHLKKQLVTAAITNFQCQDMSHLAPIERDDQVIHETHAIADANQKQPRKIINSDSYQTAESLMKKLESLHPLPISHPATHPTLNSHWSFVFTGVPTIGMKLITLLSRISCYLPFEILDFREVGLIVSNNQGKAKSVVEVRVCGVWDVVLEVCSSLRRPRDDGSDDTYWNGILKKRCAQGGEGNDLDSAVNCDSNDARSLGAEENGTLLLEHFQGIQLNGIDLPTPKQWHTTRTLEVTYMDDDIMIARTSGGEPHLLLRTSQLCHPIIGHSEKLGNNPLETHNEYYENQMEEDDESCEVGEDRWTEFFAEAMEMYGERITRCLVDREFGKSQTNQQEVHKNTRQGYAAPSSAIWKTIVNDTRMKFGDDLVLRRNKKE